jgi:V-type H+-transporting ATPase subunit d
MIDNVVNMIEGLKNKVDIEILLANIDPLGWFPEIRNIKVLEGDDYTSLYKDVLIDVFYFFLNIILIYRLQLDLIL